MNRTILTIATVLLAGATLMTSGAEACISCNYRPEVADTPVSGQSYRAKQRTYVAVAPKPTKKRIAKNLPPPKKQAAPKKVAVAKAESVAPKKATEPAPVNKVAEAVTPAADDASAETKVADLGCSKFIATVGTTVAVPCE